MNDVCQRDRRSQRTRDILITTAETLFARYGVEGASLNTITRAAGQSNRNAVQYHFGSKEGLLQAIFDKHNPGLSRHRTQLVDQLADSALSPARIIATTLITPLRHKLADPDGGEAFIHISAELITDNTHGYINRSAQLISLQREASLSRLVLQHLSHLPRDLALQRVLVMLSMAYHSLSDYLRLLQKQPDHSAEALDMMCHNLIDCIEAMLEATPSKQTAALA